MVRIGLMIEGQEDLTWERWRHFGRQCETLGFESLWRSDHFHSLMGALEREALDTWTSLAATAMETERIRFGPLVCSATFRHPSLLARTAAAVDQLSGGRLVCGLGAGWNEQEHTSFGIPFHTMRVRLEMLREQAQICKLLWSGEPVSFEGKHYRLENVRCLPVPAQKPAPLLIGGGGEKVTLRIVAEHADEWNLTGHTADGHRAKTEALDEHCKDIGRDPSTIARSWMIGYLIGRDDGEIEARADRLRTAIPTLQRMSPAEVVERLGANGWLVGTPERIAEQIRERAALGVSLVQLQHHIHDDDDALELVAAELIPALA